jgi:hypothetical protein
VTRSVFALLSPRVLPTEVKNEILQVIMMVTLVHLYSGCASFESYCGFCYVFADRKAGAVCMCVCVCVCVYVFVIVSLSSTIYPNIEINLKE